MSNTSMIWVFSGVGGRFPSGVFEDVDTAKAWISKHKLSGVLTQYPLGLGVYEWAIERGIFEIKKKHEGSSDFIQRFTSAAQKHYHFEDGKQD